MTSDFAFIYGTVNQPYRKARESSNEYYSMKEVGVRLPLVPIRRTSYRSGSFAVHIAKLLTNCRHEI
ncbi:hypothetical protein J2T12_004441 [Paenibacillus anaericanus]|nr:hypothetical protein [Paenibacillus anaericanus]